MAFDRNLHHLVPRNRGEAGVGNRDHLVPTISDEARLARER
jgi:hypothetical protein